MIKTPSQFTILLASLLLLAGCQTNSNLRSWPTDLPPKKVFINGYMEKNNVQTVKQNTIKNYLLWIKRFYQGTLVYPNGWNRATRLFLANVPNQQEKSQLAKRMHSLGIAIANEWAQENGVRNIDNTNVAIWGSALRKAAELNDHDNFINLVEVDVAKLVAREITPDEIKYERYYPEEDYDNF